MALIPSDAIEQLAPETPIPRPVIGAWRFPEELVEAIGDHAEATRVGHPLARGRSSLVRRSARSP